MVRPSPDELALATRYMTEGEERCARQATLIVLLRAQGFDVTEAERLLALFEHLLGLIRAYDERLSREAQGP